MLALGHIIPRNVRLRVCNKSVTTHATWIKGMHFDVQTHIQIIRSNLTLWFDKGLWLSSLTSETCFS